MGAHAHAPGGAVDADAHAPRAGWGEQEELTADERAGERRRRSEGDGGVAGAGGEQGRELAPAEDARGPRQEGLIGGEAGAQGDLARVDPAAGEREVDDGAERVVLAQPARGLAGPFPVADLHGDRAAPQRA